MSLQGQHSFPQRRTYGPGFVTEAWGFHPGLKGEVMQVTGDNLKPCPFCGASGDDLMMFCDPAEGRFNNGPSRRVQCGGCCIEAPYYPTEAEDVDAWNRRVTPADG